MPLKAAMAMPGYTLLPVWLMMIGSDLYVIYNHLDFMVAADQIVWIFPVSLLLNVPMSIPLAYGRVYAIYYFRWFGFLLMSFHIFLGVIAVLLWNSGTYVRESGLGPMFLLIVLVATSPLTILYIRALLYVRWLDPRSLPQEWELPIPRQMRRLSVASARSDGRATRTSAAAQGLADGPSKPRHQPPPK